MMNVLVTGGNGFIGSHIVDRLLLDEVKVRCLVRNQANTQWLDEKRIELIRCNDLTDTNAIERATDNVEFVIHCAGTLVARNQDEYDRVNVEPGRLLLDACEKQSSFKKFVLVGSLGAAGPNEGNDGPLTESETPNPVSAYGKSKLEAEQVTKEYEGRVPFAIVRLSAVYGPRDKSVFQVFESAHQKGRIFLIGPSPKWASLAHVSDIAEGIWQTALSPNSDSETFFLSSDRPYSSDELASALESCVGKTIYQVQVPGLVVQGFKIYSDLMSMFGKTALLDRDRIHTMSFQRWDCDISKAREQLNYQPKYSLADGFENTYEWYVKNKWL